MSTHVTLDSIDAATLWDAQCAWQRTDGMPAAPSLQDHNGIRIAGSSFTWISKPMTRERHVAWLREFESLQAERAQLVTERAARQGLTG